MAVKHGMRWGYGGRSCRLQAPLQLRLIGHCTTPGCPFLKIMITARRMVLSDGLLNVQNCKTAKIDPELRWHFVPRLCPVKKDATVPQPQQYKYDGRRHGKESLSSHL